MKVMLHYNTDDDYDYDGDYDDINTSTSPVQVQVQDKTVLVKVPTSKHKSTTASADGIYGVMSMSSMGTMGTMGTTMGQSVSSSAMHLQLQQPLSCHTNLTSPLLIANQLDRPGSHLDSMTTTATAASTNRTNRILDKFKSKPYKLRLQKIRSNSLDKDDDENQSPDVCNNNNNNNNNNNKKKNTSKGLSNNKQKLFKELHLTLVNEGLLSAVTGNAKSSRNMLKRNGKNTGQESLSNPLQGNENEKVSSSSNSSSNKNHTTTKKRGMIKWRGRSRMRARFRNVVSGTAPPARQSPTKIVKPSSSSYAADASSTSTPSSSPDENNKQRETNCSRTWSETGSSCEDDHNKGSTRKEMELTGPMTTQICNKNNVVARHNTSNTKNNKLRVLQCSRYGCMKEFCQPPTVVHDTKKNNNIETRNNTSTKNSTVSELTSSSGVCVFHKSPPIFHPKLKYMYWACCPHQRVRKLSELMTVQGCETLPDCTTDDKQFVQELIQYNKKDNDKVKNMHQTKQKQQNEQNRRQVQEQQRLMSTKNKSKFTHHSSKTTNDNTKSVITEGAQHNLNNDNSIRTETTTTTNELIDDYLNSNSDSDLDVVILSRSLTYYDTHYKSSMSLQCVDSKDKCDDDDHDEQSHNGTNNTTINDDENHDIRIHKTITLVEFKKVLHSFGIDSTLYDNVIDGMKREYGPLELNDEQLNRTVKKKLGAMLQQGFHSVAANSSRRQEQNRFVNSVNTNDEDDDKRTECSRKDLTDDDTQRDIQDSTGEAAESNENSTNASIVDSERYTLIGSKNALFSSPDSLYSRLFATTEVPTDDGSNQNVVRNNGCYNSKHSSVVTLTNNESKPIKSMMVDEWNMWDDECSYYNYQQQRHHRTSCGMTTTTTPLRLKRRNNTNANVNTNSSNYQNQYTNNSINNNNSSIQNYDDDDYCYTEYSLTDAGDNVLLAEWYGYRNSPTGNILRDYCFYGNSTNITTSEQRRRGSPQVSSLLFCCCTGCYID